MKDFKIEDYETFITNYHNLRYAPYEIRDNEEIIFDFMILNYGALKYASSRLRGDKQFILRCFSLPDGGNDGLLEYVSDELKDDKEVVLAALATYRWDFIVQVDYVDLRNVSERLRHDKEIVLAALKTMTFERDIDDYIDDLNWLIPDELKKDKEIIDIIKEHDEDFVFNN